MEGVVGLSWGFGLPLHDVIRGTVVDYMHCVCEGVVDQLIAKWLNKANSKQSFYLGSKVNEISEELTAITPTCEITRSPRSLADVKEWKGTSVINVHNLENDVLFSNETGILGKRNSEFSQQESNLQPSDYQFRCSKLSS